MKAVTDTTRAGLILTFTGSHGTSTHRVGINHPDKEISNIEQVSQLAKELLTADIEAIKQDTITYPVTVSEGAIDTVSKELASRLYSWSWCRSEEEVIHKGKIEDSYAGSHAYCFTVDRDVKQVCAH